MNVPLKWTQFQMLNQKKIVLESQKLQPSEGGALVTFLDLGLRTRFIFDEKLFIVLVKKHKLHSFLWGVLNVTG